MRKAIALVAIVMSFVAAQLVPYRVSNPAVHDEPQWDSPRTRVLVATACFDCHSNQTRSHWYTQVAPMSWLTTKDVRRGRAALNFSEWSTTGREHDPAGAVSDGRMPPTRYFYFGLHQDAKLSATDRADLIRGLQATVAASPGGGHSGRGGSRGGKPGG